MGRESKTAIAPRRIYTDSPLLPPLLQPPPPMERYTHGCCRLNAGEPMLHHASIRTAEIFRAIAFYEQLGFEVTERFTTGYTLGCWMEGLGGRVELLQVPQPKAPPDPFGDEAYVGYYHLSFDLTQLTSDLPTLLEALKARFATAAQIEGSKVLPLQVLLEPTQQMIGDRVYEVAFIADTDGMPLELIREVSQQV